jgi:polyferredoxin
MNTAGNTQQDPEDEVFRDRVATIDDKGKRVWIYPKKPKGRFTNARTYISWVFLIFLFGAPFVEIHGEPMLMFNILKRHFILFGIAFAPQDFYLFALAMLTFVVFIVLFTAIWGRLFCGWVCPQTVFMEMVYRKIEYWIEGDANAQRRLHASPWTTEKILKKGFKQFLFFSIAVVIANTFLAYIIGYKEVVHIIFEPFSEHWQGFVALILFSYAFYFVFAYMREQVCVAICPYGRLQGVLLDKNSIVVSYDFIRGEPRGKIRKLDQNRRSSPVDNIRSAVKQDATHIEQMVAEPLVAGATPIEQVQKSLGDCIDCGLCVQVCPTGIDIRHGTQLECVNCTACIDACDEVMDKIDRPRGLIRYDSYVGITEKRAKLFTTRVIAYTVVLSLLIVANILLFSTRSRVEVLILRTPGMLYQKMPNNHISNLYNYEVINKTQEHFPLEFRLVTKGGTIKPIGKIPDSKPIDVVEGAFFIEMERSALHRHKTTLKVDVYSRGKRIGRAKTNFLGPGY